jgi:hypothetical protein
MAGVKEGRLEAGGGDRPTGRGRTEAAPSGPHPIRRRESMSVFEVDGRVVRPGSTYLIARVRVLTATAILLAVYTLGLIV